GWILPVVRGGRAVMGASVIVDSVMPRGGDMFAGTRDGDKFVGPLNIFRFIGAQ
ncbi:unnamed protein product, partial [Didymodactylos carnosus]